MSTRMWGVGAVAAALALGLNVVPVEAQRGQGLRGAGPGEPGGPNMGRSIELALDSREVLKLTDDQAARLLELQKVMDEEIAPMLEEMKALRESVREGALDREEGRRELEALRGRIITASAPMGGGVRDVLTVAQHEKLQAIVAQERPGRGLGRAVQGGRGPGMGRGGPVGLRQGRGPGMSPVQLRGARGFLGPRNGPVRRGVGREPGFPQGTGMGPFPPRPGRGGAGPNAPAGEPGGTSTGS